MSMKNEITKTTNLKNELSQLKNNLNSAITNGGGVQLIP